MERVRTGPPSGASTVLMNGRSPIPSRARSSPVTTPATPSTLEGRRDVQLA